MGKSTITIKQVLNHRVEHGAWLAAHHALFNQVAAFYFGVIQAHPGVLDLPAQDALTALEKLTHTTERNPHPVMPLSDIRPDVPALFRRAAIHAALGSARAFSTQLATWRARKERAAARGKTWTERPPVPPRTWNKAATFYAGMWKDRTASSLVIKVWTGTCWSWLKCRLTGRVLPAAKGTTGTTLGSPSLVRHGTRWWLHTPVEQQVVTPPKIAHQVTTTPATKVCSVDLNLDGPIAVCSVQTAEGTILSTRFIGGGREIAGFRKRQLGRIARNRKRTGMCAEGELDNGALWATVRTRDESFAHLVSHRIVEFAVARGASILVFEHLGRLRPEKGRYSRRGNRKRAFWMKGRIFTYAKYKAWSHGIITSRVSPRNTSRECAWCHAIPIIRYRPGDPESGYTAGAPLMRCPACGRREHADRNASIVIGQRLIMRHQPDPGAPQDRQIQQNPAQEKPHTPLARSERGSKDSGVACSQAAEGEEAPSVLPPGHGARHGHGTAHEGEVWMEIARSAIPHQLRLFTE